MHNKMASNVFYGHGMTTSHDGQAEVAMVCYFPSCFLQTWQCYLLFKVIVGVHIPAVMFLARPIPPCSLPVAAAAADQPHEAMEWVASRGGCSSSPSGDWEAVVEATREQSGEKLKLKGFVQLCSPKCWRACRSSNVPVKMCAPRRDKIMWLKLTTRGCCSKRGLTIALAYSRQPRTSLAAIVMRECS